MHPNSPPYLGNFGSLLYLHCCILRGNRHKVPLHGIGETLLVEWWLYNGRGFTPDHHWQRFANTFHLFQNVVLTHEINDTYHQFPIVLVYTNQNRVIQYINNGQKQSILNRKVSGSNYELNASPTISHYLHSIYSFETMISLDLSKAWDDPTYIPENHHPAK